MPGHFEKRVAGPHGLEFRLVDFAVPLFGNRLARGRQRLHQRQSLIGGQARQTRRSVVMPVEP